MTRLTTESVEFARRHIEKFYDSDFYPKSFEFDALWHSWDEVLDYLTATNIHKIPSIPPRSNAWKKHRGGYRIVHQLDPLDTIIYTALVYQIAESVENTREPIDSKIACAYRIVIDDGSFFAQGSGFDDFREKSIDLASIYSFILSVDINDFYNQIYSHRVQNSIEHTNKNNKELADDIETFLNKINSKTSQGIPVGPAASIVLSEAIMTDVDQFLKHMPVEHTRYVDDFRIFGNSKHELEKILSALTLYLHDIHRLSIAGEKTKIQETDHFLKNDINNPYELAKLEIFDKLPALSDYSSIENSEDESYPINEDLIQACSTIKESIEDLVKRRSLDLGFSRALIRQARLLKYDGIINIILLNLYYFEPIVNNFIVYLDAITKPSLIRKLIPEMEKICPVLMNCTNLTRLWFEWYWTEHPPYLKSQIINNFVRQSNYLETQSRAAVACNELSWIRKHKSIYFTQGPIERRSILYAARLMPADERNHWLKSVIESTVIPIEKWVAKYIIDIAELGDDIPF